MTKRLITLLLAGVLILSLFPAHVLATERDGAYQLGDTLEVEGIEAPTAEIPQGTRWEQQGEAVQRPGTEPICGKNPHTHGEESGCQLQCTLPEHTHVLNCGENCGLHVHTLDCCKAIHIHGTGCNCEIEAHSHNESCYSCTHVCDASCQIGEDGICLNAHTHDESCPYTCGKDAHIHSDACCTAQHQHSESCAPGCGQEGHTHITNGCGGDGVCTLTEHSHGDGSSCQMACTLEEHGHADGCYERITYTTWKVVEEILLFNTGNGCTLEEDHFFATLLEEGYPHIHELTLQPGQTKNLVFRFGTEESNNSLGMGDLTAENMHFAPGDQGIAVGPTSNSTQYVVYGEHRFPVTGKLPDYALYSQESREGQYAVTGYNNVAGTEITLYIMWAENREKPTSINAVNNSIVLDESLFTYDLDPDMYASVTFKAPVSGSIFFELTFANSSPVTIELKDQRVTVSQDAQHLKVLDYNGTAVTVGFGISPDYIRLNTDGGSRFSYEASYPYDQYFTFYLGALQNFGTHEELPAPQSFYDAITNVSITIESFENLTGNSTICNGSFQEAHSKAVTVDNINTWGNTLVMPAKKLFKATFAMSFDYAGATHTLKLPFTFDSADTLLEASDLDTADELNAILESSEALLTWFEAKDKAAYDRFVASRDGFIDIYLPNVDYDKPIVSTIIPSESSRIYYNCVRLHAHPDGTSLPGLTTTGGIFALFGLDFIAPEGMGNTCGILAEGGIASNTLSAVVDCTFDGFHYGIRSTATGHVAQVSNSVFTDCDNAIYVDCTKTPTVRSDTMYYYRNRFIGGKFAITIRNHPNGSTPYATYASENSFIGCNKDFKITTPGNPHYYHFVKNFYGNASQARSSGSYIPRSAAIDVTENPNAVVVTNPCLVAYSDYATLGIDDTAGLHSMIFNSESENLKVSGTELAKIQRETKVQILDQKENTVATWIFGGAEE